LTQLPLFSLYHTLESITFLVIRAGSMFL